MDWLRGIDWSLALTGALLVVDWTLRIVAVIVVPRNRRPQTATAWLLAIFLVPTLGMLLFALLGSTRLPKRRRDKQRDINQFILDSTGGMEKVRDDDPPPAWFSSAVFLNRELGAMPLVGGNSAELLPDYDASLRAMTDAVRQAKRYVHAEFYITHIDATTEPFFQALEEAVQRGVTVRYLLDHIASWRYPKYRQTMRRLRATGAQVQLMLPVRPWRGEYQRPDLRNHRKLLVIDGTVAYTGSQNMIDKSYDKPGNLKRGLAWKDLMVRFEGPIVAGINALFVTDWYSETDELLLRETEPMTSVSKPQSLDCQVVPSGPGFDGENNLRLFNALIYSAQQRIVLTSPYFVPDESMLYAVTTAAQRGVAVDLIVSEIGDQPVVFHAQRSYYEALLRAGVRIWLYRAPTILHAKHFTIDDEVSVIGSSNLDMRSFSLNLEISVLVRGEDFARRLHELEDAYRAECRELTLDEWLARPFPVQVLDNVARLTASVQ